MIYDYLYLVKMDFINMKTASPFLQGIRDGLPIGFGYLAVSFSVGITARNAGLTAIQGFIMSWLGMASAGEYAAITVIASGAPYWEMALITLITNARYLLMSFALSQRLAPDLNIGHRLLIGYSVTDELFGIAVSQPKPLEPAYSYGSYLVAIPSWATGTAIGIMAGNILPARIVSALSVLLFGMFLAVIIPPAKKNKIVLLFIILSFMFSFVLDRLNVFSFLSAGSRTILLTVLLSTAAAVLFPIRGEHDEE